MQKKLVLAVLSACASLLYLPNANAMVCPFTDSFFIQAPLPLRIINASVSGNLGYSQMSSNFFTLSCGDNGNSGSGDLHVEIGMSDDVKCSLTIHDGPYEMNPTINEVFCGGPAGRIYFVGMEHPYRTYNYTLKFTM